MAVVNVVGKVRVGQREYILKETPLFLPMYKEMVIRGTAMHLRQAAYGVKDYIIDKILAQMPPVGERKIYRRETREKTVDDLPEPEEQSIDETEDYALHKVHELPPRDTKEAFEARLPYEFHPLSKRYFDKKIRTLDARTLVSTGDYLRGIVVRKRQDRLAGTIYVITMANRKHKLSDLMLSDLAKIMEFGTSSYRAFFMGDKDRPVQIQIPARPHWRPAFEYLKEVMERIGADASAWALEEAIRKLR